MATFGNRLAHAWNAFRSTEERELEVPYGLSATYGAFAPHRPRLQISNEKSMVSAIYTRLSIDVSSFSWRHIRVDKNGRFIENIDSGLQYCLTQEANIDQTPFALFQEIAHTMFDQGHAAVVPVNTSLNPNVTGGYDILDLRVGHVVTWYPDRVKVHLYNEKKGEREDVIVMKKSVAIIYNPLYAIMNAPNSTLTRLINKLNLLDVVDEQSNSGRLDVIIQLPYAIKSEARRQQAEQRKTDIEQQLRGSQYGIAYTDATEKVTQLNRPAENNLMTQIEYLVELLYNQLGLTKEIMSGTADEKAMINYTNRTIKPILTAITEAFRRSFLTKTARTQLQTIQYFANPFSLVPVADMAEIADKFTRNEILTSNEIRQYLGIPPADDPQADELRNSNMPEPNPETAPKAVDTKKEGDSQNGSS